MRLLSFALAVLLVMGGFLLRSERQRRLWEMESENGWKRAFGTLSADLTEIDTALKKCRAAGSDALAGDAAVEIYARAQEAQALLGELPLSGWQLDGITGYLGRLGDYALSLSRSAVRGRLSPEERENLSALGAGAAKLNEGCLELQASLEEGTLTAGQLQELASELPGQRLLGDDLLALADEFPELPTLIYDGPYSESAVVGPARMLEGLEPVSEEDAIRAAADFTGRGADSFTVLGRSEGTLPCYLLTAGKGPDTVTLRVTRQGGIVADLVSGLGGYAGSLSPEEAVGQAKTFLKARGFDALRETYWTKEDGSVLISFASQQDGWTCYPDLIKVRVSLDGGAVIGFDAVGYLMNHRERELPTPVSAETARASVSPSLTVLSEGLAVIPTEGKQERCCREFKCADGDGIHFIVYADAETGEEVKLLMLIESENGTLVM